MATMYVKNNKKKKIPKLQDGLLPITSMKGNSYKVIPTPGKVESIKMSLKASTKNLDFYFSWHKKKSKA